MIPWWGVLLLIIFAFISEAISTFCFNMKIITTKSERFLLASFFGATATMVYLLFSSLTIYFGVSSGQIYISIIAFVFLAIGNFLSTLIFDKLSKKGIIDQLVSEDFNKLDLFKKSFWTQDKSKESGK